MEVDRVSLFFRRAEQRAINYQDLWATGGDVTQLFNGTEGALRLVPLFGAHRTIIDAVSATPLHAYREQAGGISARVPRQPPLLTRFPFGGSQFSWKSRCVASMVSDGNAFGLVTSLGPDGWPSGLLWLDPRRVGIESDDAHVAPQYYVDGRWTDPASIVHIPWIVPPGKHRGLSPLKMFITAFEMGQSAQQMGRDWFVNGAMPSGHLKSTNILGPGQADETKRKWKAAIQGRDVFVSGADWDFTAIGVPADEARFIETLKLSATQIAAIYGIPPEEIGGEAGGSLTYATVEGNERRLASRVVRPWAVRIEEALSLAMPRPVFAKFNLDAIVRADLMTRMQAHLIAQQAGMETNGEGRALEDRPPLTDTERAEWLALWRQPGADKTTPPPKGQ
jgi:HK97 family phage portal protein